MMHKFFFIGMMLMGVITLSSLMIYIEGFDLLQSNYQHLSALAGIGLNLMWVCFFYYLYNQNKPKKEDIVDLNELDGIIKDFKVGEGK